MSKFKDRLWRELVREHGAELAQMSTAPAPPNKATRLSSLRRPRVAGAFALVAALGLNASGAFGLNVLGLHSALTATSLPSGFQSAADAAYGIFPTQTTCTDFTTAPQPSGAPEFPVTYPATGPAPGTITQGVTPGVFFYWVQVPMPGTYTITQSVSNAPIPKGGGSEFFTLAAGSFAFDSSCTRVPFTSTGSPMQSASDGSVSLTFTAAGSGPPYSLGIKYSTKDVVGDTPPPGTFPPGGTALYTFTTSGVTPHGGPGIVSLQPLTH